MRSDFQSCVEQGNLVFSTELNSKLHFVSQSYLLLSDSWADSPVQQALSLETKFCVWNCVVLHPTAAINGWEPLGNSSPSSPPVTLL